MLNGGSNFWICKEICYESVGFGFYSVLGDSKPGRYISKFDITVNFCKYLFRMLPGTQKTLHFIWIFAISEYVQV